VRNAGLTYFSFQSPGVLLAASTRLLDARDDFEEQRICIEMSYGVVMLYSKCIEVRDVSLLYVTQLTDILRVKLRIIGTLYRVDYQQCPLRR
jgi:hypothetical protein